MNRTMINSISTLFALTLTASAQSTPNGFADPNAWQLQGQTIHLSSAQYATDSYGDKTGYLQSDLKLTVYKTKAPIRGYDYYLVTGVFWHSSTVIEGSYNATNMALSILADGPGSEMFDPGTLTSVGSTTTSWQVGGGLGAGGGDEGNNGVNANVNFSYGQSFSVQDANFTTSPSSNQVTVNVELPGDYSKPVSRAYTFYPSFIFRVQRSATGLSQGFHMAVASTVSWNKENAYFVEADRVGSFAVDFTNKQINSPYGGNRCLGLIGNTPALATCDNHPDQQWSINANSQLVNTATGTCLDTTPDSLSVLMNPCNLTDSSTGQTKQSQMFLVGTDNIQQLFGGIHTVAGRTVTVNGKPSAPAVGSTLTTSGPIGIPWAQWFIVKY